MEAYLIYSLAFNSWCVWREKRADPGLPYERLRRPALIPLLDAGPDGMEILNQTAAEEDGKVLVAS